MAAAGAPNPARVARSSAMPSRLILVLPVAAVLSGCVVGTVVGTAVDVAATAVETSADIVGAGVDAAIPGDDDD
jgi:hypothetical protein